MSYPSMITIANAAVLVGLIRCALAITASQPPSHPEPATASDEEEGGSYCDADYFLPRCSPPSCFDLGDRADRDDCLRVELEDQAVAYSTGVEAYHRPVQVRRLPEPVHWKTLPPS
jgi:hypothetical protein